MEYNMVLPSSYRDSGTKWVNQPLEILNFDQTWLFSSKMTRINTFDQFFACWLSQILLLKWWLIKVRRCRLQRFEITWFESVKIQIIMCLLSFLACSILTIIPTIAITIRATVRSNIVRKHLCRSPTGSSALWYCGKIPFPSIATSFAFHLFGN